MTGFDLAVIIFVVASGLFAFVRGFVKEVLSIIAWFGASVAALYAVPYLRPLALRFTPNEQLAGASAALVAFIAALVVLSVITAVIANRVKDSPAGGIDRTVGFVFGLARGSLLACLVYAAMLVLMPTLSATPAWWTKSRTRPLLAAGLSALGQLAPRTGHADRGQSVERQLQDALHALSAPKSGGQPQAGAASYSPQDQRDLDRLFQQTQGTR